MSELTPIQLASRASKAAAAADKKDPHSEATKDAHGDAHGHWHHLAKSEKDDFYKSHYATMAKHHFDRSYGKDSKMPYRVENEEGSAMDVKELLGLLEDVRASFDEASPPPFKAKERQAAGLPAMPTRKGAQPPPIPMKAKKIDKEAELKKRRAADAPARAKKQSDQLAVDKKRMSSGGTRFGTKNLGIKRSFSSYKVPGAKPGARDDDAAAGVKMAGAATKTRAAKGESLDLVAGIRGLLETERYGGGSPLGPRELAAKGMTKRSRRKIMPKAL